MLAGHSNSLYPLRVVHSFWCSHTGLFVLTSHSSMYSCTCDFFLCEKPCFHCLQYLEGMSPTMLSTCHREKWQFSVCCLNFQLENPFYYYVQKWLGLIPPPPHMLNINILSIQLSLLYHGWAYRSPSSLSEHTRFVCGHIAFSVHLEFNRA